MAAILQLRDAIKEFVHDGDTVALEGFTHLIPFAAGHEIIRQQRTNLTLVRMTPDVIYDQLIGAGCASKLVFSWGGNPGVGSLHRLRDAVENDWPRPLEVEEHAHAGMAARYQAGASGLPFGVLRGYLGTDLPKYNDSVKFIECPFTGEQLAAVPALHPDVTVIHAQKADRKGNVLMWGVVGAQKEAVLCGEALDRDRRGNRRRARRAAELRRAAVVGGRRGVRGEAAARFLPTRSATTSATTPSTSSGTPSRASARAFKPGSTDTS